MAGVIKTELMRHANSGITSLFPAAVAEMLLQVENAAFNLMFMTPDQGALTQVATLPHASYLLSCHVQCCGYSASCLMSSCRLV